MEKVENLYRTAPEQNDSINTPEQFESRLRDAVRANRMARAIERRAPQDESVERQFDEQPEGYEGDPGNAARQ
jgi:hypothetical protein